MAWWNFSSWFGGWFGFQTNRELAAIAHLEQALRFELREIEGVIPLLEQIKAALAKNDFGTAERFIPQLTQLLKNKNVADQREKIDWSIFQKTLLGDLK